ncbi:hypothetical protein GGX14DRAFT_389102 [Mycena pura]|uniref:Uncharacterized protein n=1 Tax=Mycena pura TaxID=153505 RepID=A0AAD6VUH1_9AGAR|nr:hypothetical protein GGX14DRAFT_389102 [Mycena pura]
MAEAGMGEFSEKLRGGGWAHLGGRGRQAWCRKRAGLSGGQLHTEEYLEGQQLGRQLNVEVKWWWWWWSRELAERDITHVSDSEPEREADRQAERRARRSHHSFSPPPHSSSRTTLGPIHNTTAQSNTQILRKNRLDVLEGRLQVVEKDIEHLKQQGIDATLVSMSMKSRSSPPPTTLQAPETASMPPATTNDLENDPYMRGLLAESLREMKDKDPRIYKLPVPVRTGNVTRRIGFARRTPV